VYKISEGERARPYALSVMDIIDLSSKGMATAVVQEVQIALLCSSLLSLNICPNLVEVHSLFQSELGAPASVWNGEAKSKVNLRRQIGAHKRWGDKQQFQYIRMEFCSGGDLECVVRQLCVPDLSLVQSYLFQMCFSMYTCREKLSMRHFDIKLLNFFMSTADCLLRTPAQQSQQSQQTQTQQRGHGHGQTHEVDLHIGLGEHIYKLPLATDGFSVVKLADFGTSVVGSAGLGEPITQMQFTTLENTPPEFLLLGSWARQGCSADTFPLGLCFFHLLTGYEPYEELLKDVRCPPHLCEKLAHFWRTAEESSPYFVVAEVIDSLDTEALQLDGSDPGSVLYDTLYRYLVLFGAGADFQSDKAFAEAFSVYADSPVWAVVCETLGLRKLDLSETGMGMGMGSDMGRGMATRGGGGRRGGGGGRDADPESSQQYSRDLAEWSLHQGSNPIMRNCRERLARLGAISNFGGSSSSGYASTSSSSYTTSTSTSVLDGMLHFDPARRATMFDLLQHPMFAPLRLSPMHPMMQGQGQDPSAGSYLHYFRPPSNGAHALPIL
jgi:serine/threonine protein kinase